MAKRESSFRIRQMKEQDHEADQEEAQPGFQGECGMVVLQRERTRRYGTITLFAALNVLAPLVIGECMSRHRHQEFPNGLDFHLIVDNYGPHQQVKEWLW